MFKVAVLLPESLNVDHRVDDAPLVHLSHGRDSLVLSVRTHGLPGSKRSKVTAHPVKVIAHPVKVIAHPVKVIAQLAKVKYVF